MTENLYWCRKYLRKVPVKVLDRLNKPFPTVTEGVCSREKVGEICKNRGYKSVLIVTDVTVKSLGFTELIEKSLYEYGINYSVFSDISSEPDSDIVKNGHKALIESNAECIIALGGGSVMDSSKMISASTNNKYLPIAASVMKFVLHKTLPLIMIPTTSGTGAETTFCAVVKNLKTGKKGSTVFYDLNITDIILDSFLTVNSPKNITFFCGIDALCHGLEAWLADVSVSDEKDFSGKCVKLVFENLPVLLENPDNIEARQNMCRAAYYGGISINTQVCGYVHAFAHAIGAKCGISHGKAIAVSIIPVLYSQRTLFREKLAKLSVYCGFASYEDEPVIAEEKFFSELIKLIKSINFGFEAGFICKADYNDLIKNIDSDSISYNNMRVLHDSEIRCILNRINCFPRRIRRM